ncbi:hypothetical protein [Streptomyces sp. NPDC052042]|uniref:hypothetical protein n=1 Tax=Streptomyces sp. NPDC052042 TaxID=3365683 RepID=UPI0037D2EE0C
MLTPTHLATALDAIDWNRPRACAKASREVLGAGADRWQLRLHAFPMGELELIPHDHKYPFAVRVLHCGYLHTWNRRTGQTQTGPFTSDDLAAGTVTAEGPGSGYLLLHSLVHQTAALPGSVTLFLRGPAPVGTRHQTCTTCTVTTTDARPVTTPATGAPPPCPPPQNRVADLTRLGVITTERPARP